MSRYVIFDLFHTLVHGADDERDLVVAEMAQIIGVDPAGLVRAYHDSWPERLVSWNVEQTVRTLAGRLGAAPSDEQVMRAATLRRDLARRVVSVVRPSTLRVLADLRAGGWRLGMISNATAETAEAWSGSPLAPHLDVAIFSSEIGLAKPDLRIYQAGTEALGTVPAAAYFVGDGADDELAGAVAAGMRVIRTTEYNNTVPSWTGPVVASLDELPVLLARAETSQGV